MATSYTNKGAINNRTGLITITGDVGWGWGSIYELINGTEGNSAWFSGGAASGKYFKFDFGSGNAPVIDGFKWLQDSSSGHGNWKFEGSNNDTDWTTLESATALATAATTEHSFSNSTGYRYYRLLGDSGNISGGPYIREIKFKIDNSLAADTSYANEGGTGNRTSIITVTASSGVFWTGSVSTLVDGANAQTLLSAGNDITGKYIQFDFGSGNSKIIDELYWNDSGWSHTAVFSWQGSDNGSDWTTLGSGYRLTYTGIAILPQNGTGYRYYRLYGESGIIHGNPYIYEVEFKIVNSNPVTNYDDGTPSGGIVFGGQVVEVGAANYTDPAASGGIVIGGASGSEVEPVEVHQTDGAASGGIVFGGSVAERWYSPWAVAVKGGTYRIGGNLYTLAESAYYEGIGSIAAIVTCGAPPATAGYFRYDLLSINAAGTITVTAGTEAATPIMPSTPSGEIKLDHVLRYYGQTSIIQADIGKTWSAPVLTTMTATVDDDELAWAESSTDIDIKSYDQYGTLYTGSKVINAAITTGNGTIAPASRSGSGSTFTFTYTRGGADPGDVSPVITFSSPTGAFVTAFIKLLDVGGDLMV